LVCSNKHNYFSFIKRKEGKKIADVNKSPPTQTVKNIYRYVHPLFVTDLNSVTFLLGMFCNSEMIIFKLHMRSV